MEVAVVEVEGRECVGGGRTGTEMLIRVRLGGTGREQAGGLLFRHFLSE